MRDAALGRAGLEGLEAVDPLRIGRGAPPSRELRVVVAAIAVGLPDLDHHVVERRAVALRDFPDDLYFVAELIGARGEFAREERPERHLAGRNELHGSLAVA